MEKLSQRSKPKLPGADIKMPACLIVEDSEFDRLKLLRVIDKSHHRVRVECATSLRAARAALKRGEISLILLDNHLPDGLGADFVLELARSSQLDGVSVIIVSDWPSPFMWEKAASAGVAHVLSKSEFDVGYVNAAIQRTADQSRRLN